MMNDNSMPFIVFEGTDGAGKSTIARAVFDHFDSHSMNFKFIDKNRPPVVSGYAEYHLSRLREVLWDYPKDAPLQALGDEHWLNLIVSWFQAVDSAAVSPLLNEGAICISDSWYYKYLARFLLKPGTLASFAKESFSRIREPDLIIFLDVDPQIALDRKLEIKLSESGAYDGSNGNRAASFISYQSKVRKSYDACMTDNWITIDTAGLSETAVLQRAIDIICKTCKLTACQ